MTDETRILCVTLPNYVDHQEMESITDGIEACGFAPRFLIFRGDVPAPAVAWAPTTCPSCGFTATLDDDAEALKPVRDAIAQVLAR